VTRDVRVAVDDETENYLRTALRTDSRLVVVRRETLFENDRVNHPFESFPATSKSLASGEDEVVDITRVACATACRRTRKPHVEAIGAQISKRRRAWRPLRQVPGSQSCMLPMQTAVRIRLLVSAVRCNHAQDITWHHVGDELRQNPRCRRRVAKCPKQRLDAPGTNARKEIFQIDAQHQARAGMGRRCAQGRPALHAPVGRRMRRYLGKYLVEDASLNRTEPRLGDLEQAMTTAALRDPAMAIMT